jgi:uncharacterized protein YjbJ (UPF0337 family)
METEGPNGRFPPDAIKRRRNEEIAMNWDTVKGNWKQVAGSVREQWGKLTDDDLTQIEGQREQLVGMVQTRYGLAKEKAEEQVRDWEASAKTH